MSELEQLPVQSVIFDGDLNVLSNLYAQQIWHPLSGYSEYERDFGVSAEDVILPVHVLWRSEQ